MQTGAPSNIWLNLFTLHHLVLTRCVYSLFSSAHPALGPEQTPLHPRETPAGGPAHAEEEPHGCLPTKQLCFGEGEIYPSSLFTNHLIRSHLVH